MSDRRLVFHGPGRVAAEACDPGHPGPGQVGLVTLVSAISAGTEGLLWRGAWPDQMSLDGSWATQAGSANYPVAYGYACVGRVEVLGPGVDPSWRGRRAFTFSGHQTRTVADLTALWPLPEGMDEEDGVFLASMETALSLAQDAAPVAGETVGIWGLGTIGLLTAALLSGSNPVLAWDTQAFRREGAQRLGWGSPVLPGPQSCDVVIETTGNPVALDEALGATRFSGRVVVGSWYGQRPVPVALGGEFHRSRIQIVSSQVSTLSPVLSGRWTKTRRLQTAMELVEKHRPSRMVTHRFSLDQAEEAYRQACDRPDDGLQVLFTYR